MAGKEENITQRKTFFTLRLSCLNKIFLLLEKHDHRKPKIKLSLILGEYILHFNIS